MSLHLLLWLVAAVLALFALFTPLPLVYAVLAGALGEILEGTDLKRLG